MCALRAKRTRPERKQPSVSGPPPVSDGCSIVQGSPPKETEDVFIDSSDISDSTSLGAVMKEVAVLKVMKGADRGPVDAASSPLVRSDKPVVKAPFAPTHSLLDLLADQALARDPPPSVSQELLAAAVAKYKHSVQPWSFMLSSKSPPLPPPPPQSSPVGFPVCQVVEPRLLHVGNSAHHVDPGQVQSLSDDADIIIQ